MSVKPILFSISMVRAILAGHKTMTRRVVKPQPTTSMLALYTDDAGPYPLAWWVDNSHWLKPYYQPDDVLWVRETWREDILSCDENPIYDYKADPFESEPGDMGLIGSWHPSIHMPRKAARLFLRVTAVRSERLQDITNADAIAEGFASVGEFRATFDNIMSKSDGGDWYTNPWVWVYTFERCEAPT